MLYGCSYIKNNTFMQFCYALPISLFNASGISATDRLPLVVSQRKPRKRLFVLKAGKAGATTNERMQ